ncbi:MAG: metal-dependent hydrolase [Haliea sp.]|uniref:metal-dependent hydrolase n=1 Tax=Haliea sp. TaxID=1932666 RepID=UPI0032F02062
MDPLTQGALGAALPQATASRRQVLTAGLLGFLSGMAPDLDVLIRSAEDPLLFLEYHRQFTHALVFIPVGGLLCALLLHRLIGRRAGLGFWRSYLFCTLGYATHGLLDACTTYGTLLLWPFSDQRFAWNTISIIDPLFTLPVLALIIVAAVRQRPALARAAVIWGLAYLALGAWQRDRAEALGEALAAERGHAPVRLEAKPSFANILVWKVVYETATDFHVDAVRTWPSAKVYPGSSIPRLDAARDLPWLDPASQQARDVARFAWFSNDYVASDPLIPGRVIDVRYSLLPNEIDSLWSIQLTPGAAPEQHVSYAMHRNRREGQIEALWRMLLGQPLSGGEYRVGGL